MKHTLLTCCICLCTLILSAQPNVFNTVNSQIHYSNKIIEMNSGYIICNSPNGNGFQLMFVDSLGNTIFSKTHGTPNCFLDYSRLNSNNEIMLLGHSFWQIDSTISSNHKGFVSITDLEGNEKRSFFLYDSTTLFNIPYNGVYFHGNYFFVGIDYHVSSPIDHIFVCKTDTFGNIKWYTSNFTQGYSTGMLHYGIEVSHKNNSILIGARILDSISNGSVEYYSYLLNELDTNGNFIQRINLPNMNNLSPCPCIHNINQISQLPDKKYGIAASENYMILDSTYLVIENDTNLNNQIGGDFGNKHLTENSYSYGGYKGFKKLYNGAITFTRTFENEPNMVTLNDLIPTNDGGYIGIIHNIGATRIIKMDCEGNYTNPIWCYPNSVNNQMEFENWEVYPNPCNLLLIICGYKGFLKHLYNSVGQLLLTTHENKLDLSSFSKGIYFLECNGNFKKVIVQNN